MESMDEIHQEASTLQNITAYFSQKRKKRSMLHSKSASPPPTPTRLSVEAGGGVGTGEQKKGLFR